MNQVFRPFLAFFMFVIIIVYGSTAYTQEESAGFTIVFGWKTEGLEVLLAKKASALKQIKKKQGIALSFGSLLGPTRIVEHDRGDQFLSAAKQAGFNYVIPAAAEFIIRRKILSNCNISEFPYGNIIHLSK